MSLPKKNPIKPVRVHHREGKERSIISAAVEIFSEKGFDMATTREIAEKAGCAEGLIFRYFGTKDGLLVRCLEAMNKNPLPHLQTFWKEPVSLQDTLLESFLWFARHYRENPQMAKIAVVRSILDEKIAAVVGRLFSDPLLETMAVGLRKLKQAHLVRPDLDIDASTRMILQIIFGIGFLRQQVFGDGKEKTETYLKEIVRILTLGMSC